MQMKNSTLLSIAAAAVASTKFAHMISALEFDDVLRPLGLSQRRGWSEKLAFLGAGIVVGGVAALLFAPSSGAKTRERLAKKADELGDAAANKVREIGEQLRDEATAAHARYDNNHALSHAAHEAE